MNYYQDDGDDFSEDLSEIETPPKGTKRVKVKAVPVRKPQHQIWTLNYYLQMRKKNTFQALSMMYPK